MRSRNLLWVLALLMAGCGGRQTIQPGGPTPGQTPIAGGPQTPSLVDLKAPVSDTEYDQALSLVGQGEADRRNAGLFLTIAQYQYNHGRLDEALKTYQKTLLGSENFNGQDKAQYMVGQIYFEKKDYLPSLAAFQKVPAKSPQSSYAAQARQMMDFVLSYSLGMEDLKKYIENYPDSPLQCTAQFQLASREAQAGIQSEAMEHLNRFLQQCPQHPSASAAQLLLSSLQNQAQGKTWKVAVLVPKTGKYAGFGESVWNGISLAIEQSNESGGPKKHMAIVVKDTGSDGMKAVNQFQDLVKDDSLDAIIGPVAPGDIQAVAALANQKRISLICPAASREGLSTLGSYIFTNSMTNEMQGRAIARYAVEKLGYKRLAILAPQDAYGQTLAQNFQKTVESMGASVVGIEAYPPGSTDFKTQLVHLGGQDPESTKENDRENTRRLEKLKYDLGKETGKVFLRVKDLLDAAGKGTGTTPVAAFAPFVEGLGNTLCPSIAKGVNGAIREALKDQTGFTLRSDDIMKQSMSRLPVELKGTTLTATADQWEEVAQDMQATVLLTGHIVEPNPDKDWTPYPNWDYNIHFEAFWVDPKKGKMTRFYQSKIPYSSFKPPALIRANGNYQALYLPAHAVEVPLLVSQLHFYDLSPTLLGGHLWDNESILQESAKDMEGAYFVTGFYIDSQQGTTKKFVEDYMRKFAKRPELTAAQAYDATRLLIQAANLSSNRDDIHNNLMAIKDFDGVSGKTNFDGKGEAEKLVPIIKIQGGKYQQVQ